MGDRRHRLSSTTTANLHITGRKKTAFATAHGRKLAPEWIESELTGRPAIAQAALFGEGRELQHRRGRAQRRRRGQHGSTGHQALNQTLPDYARIKRWIIADEPFSFRNGLANGAGTLIVRPSPPGIRQQIESCIKEANANAIL